MSLSPVEYLKHIQDEINYILSRSDNLTKDDLLADETLKRAFARSVEIIGEAAKKVPEDFRQKHPDIEWRSMTGMQDILVHDYFGVDYDILWDVIANKIPLLRDKIAKIIQAEEK